MKRGSNEPTCKACFGPVEPALEHEIKESPSRVDAGLCRDCWDEMGAYGAMVLIEDELVDDLDDGVLDEETFLAARSELWRQWQPAVEREQARA